MISAGHQERRLIDSAIIILFLLVEKAKNRLHVFMYLLSE